MIPIVDLSFTEKLRSGKLDSILTMPVDLKLYFVTLHLENLMFNWILNSIFVALSFIVKILLPVSFSQFLSFLMALAISLILYFQIRIFFTTFTINLERADALAY
jgi:ABC-type uncharacterized transport system permease subunit